jgi:hypothetical protein
MSFVIRREKDGFIWCHDGAQLGERKYYWAEPRIPAVWKVRSGAELALGSVCDGFACTIMKDSDLPGPPPPLGEEKA